MKELTIENARAYAMEMFRELPGLLYQWNIIHSECMIEALDMLLKDRRYDRDKLAALAWVHDIGKLRQETDHAQASLRILRKVFMLDRIDEDCILNHGSSGRPATGEGKIFRFADGLSLFFHKAVIFRFHAGVQEGLSRKEVRAKLVNLYRRYKERYSGSEQAVKLLESLYKNNVPDD